MLTLGRNRLSLEVETLFMMDSLQMTNAHREQIALRCIHAKEDHIVITHGTDTMAETSGVFEAIAGTP
jgi:L-asparaginase